MSLPASSVLTDPGPLCDGQPATLTCNITGGSALNWGYGVAGGEESLPTVTSAFQSPLIMMVGSVEFTVSLLETSPVFVSGISFVASTVMNGRVLTCIGSGATDEQINLQVVNGKFYQPLSKPTDD